jgi:hypothetical protein
VEAAYAGVTTNIKMLCLCILYHLSPIREMALHVFYVSLYTPPSQMCIVPLCNPLQALWQQLRGSCAPWRLWGCMRRSERPLSLN